MQKVARNEKVARNKRSCQKVAEQLVESPTCASDIAVMAFKMAVRTPIFNARGSWGRGWNELTDQILYYRIQYFFDNWRNLYNRSVVTMGGLSGLLSAKKKPAEELVNHPLLACKLQTIFVSPHPESLKGYLLTIGNRN